MRCVRRLTSNAQFSYNFNNYFSEVCLKYLAPFLRFRTRTDELCLLLLCTTSRTHAESIC